MSKLKRFNKSNKKNIMPLVALCAVVAVVSAAISYAVYQKEDEILFINARVGEFETSSSDIELAMTLDGEDIDTPPSKGDGYYNVTVECDYADGEWDKDRWAAVIENISSNRIKCNVNFETLNKLSSIAELGDYVSMTPTSTSYTIPASLTGNSSNQTINPSELNLWRVIKKNDDGTVDMVSDKVTNNYIQFIGKIGYINFIAALNTIASQYTNEKYVERTRHVGYSNQTETITDTSALSMTSEPFPFETSLYSDWVNCNTDTYMCGVDEEKGAGDIGYVRDYELINRVYGSMKAYNVNGTASSYWIASRIFKRYQNDCNNFFFFPRIVNNEGNLFYEWLFLRDPHTGFVSKTASSAVRPILTLKENVSITSGDGKSASTAFQLG